MQNVKVGMYRVFNLIKIQFSDQYEEGMPKYENSYVSAMETLLYFSCFQTTLNVFLLLLFMKSAVMEGNMS